MGSLGFHLLKLGLQNVMVDGDSQRQVSIGGFGLIIGGAHNRPMFMQAIDLVWCYTYLLCGFLENWFRLLRCFYSRTRGSACGAQQKAKHMRNFKVK